MRPLRMTALAVILSVLAFGIAAHAASRTAVETIRAFYQTYLNYDASKTPEAPRPKIDMSKSFSAAIRYNADICAKYVSGPCGWGADGDEYLDAQETGPELNYGNSGITVREIAPHIVQVRLNVYPSLKDAGAYYARTITCKMVQERGAWVVDDVTYTDGISERKRMADENADAIAHPDPEALRKSKTK